MNNEDSSEMGKWRWRISTRVRERSHLGTEHDGERRRGGLVSVHPSIRPQRRHEENGGRCVMDKGTRGDGPCRSINQRECLLWRQIRHQRWGGEKCDEDLEESGRGETGVSGASAAPQHTASSSIYHPSPVLSANTSVSLVHIQSWHAAAKTL